jgi:hypothetical protein
MLSTAFALHGSLIPEKLNLIPPDAYIFFREVNNAPLSVLALLNLLANDFFDSFAIIMPTFLPSSADQQQNLESGK